MGHLAEWFARPHVALCFLAFGMAVISLNDALIKLLGETMPLGQIVAIRSLMSFLHCPFQFWPAADDGSVVIGILAICWAWHVPCRGDGAVLCLAGGLFLPALLPFLYRAFADNPLVGSSAGRENWFTVLSVIAGMAGCLLIIRPGTADFQRETLLVLGSALSYALFQIWTRWLKSVGDLPAMVAVQHCCYAVAGGAMVLFNFALPFNDLENASLAFLLRGPISVDATDIAFIFVCASAVLLLSCVIECLSVC